MSKPSRLLLLTFYYPPDLSAGSFRAEALTSALLEESPDLQVDVLTAEPSRYGSYTPQAQSQEQHDRLTIKRVSLPRRRSGALGQAWLFVCFAWQTMRQTRGRDYDLVLATSTRLMTAVLGAYLAWRKRARLYLDIRDIFVETLDELLRSPMLRPLIGVFAAVERCAFMRAGRINLVSPGFLPYFQARYPGKCFSLCPNGVDLEFEEAFKQSAPANSRPLHILYAGNIGDGQGLQHLVPELALRLAGRAHICVVGDGARRQTLCDELARQGVSNVELFSPVKRTVLRKLYEDADVLLLHLNDWRAFRRVLPSKLFEYAASGKPILAGVAGYPADFIEAEVANAAVFRPCDAEEAVAALSRLKLESVCRKAFVARFARQRIMRELAHDIVALLRE